MKKLILASLVSFALIGDLKAATLQEVNFEGWLIGAYSSDQTGRFNHCAASIGYKSGINLSFAVSHDFKWSMGFFNSQWKLQPGASYDLSFSIDASPQFPIRGYANNTQLIEVQLADSRALFESFRRGYRLNVFAAGQTFAFSLNNTSKILTALLQCSSKYSPQIAAPTAPTPSTTNPFVARSAPATPTVTLERSEARTEATIFLANVLSAAGIPGFVVMPREKIPEYLATYDAVFTAENILFGGITIVAAGVTSDVGDVTSYLMTADSQSCQGVFASGRYPKQEGGAVRLRTACTGTTNPIEVDYTIAPRANKGGFYVFTVVTTEEKAQTARSTGERVYDAALRSFGQR